MRGAAGQKRDRLGRSAVVRKARSDARQNADQVAVQLDSSGRRRWSRLRSGCSALEGLSEPSDVAGDAAARRVQGDERVVQAWLSRRLTSSPPPALCRLVVGDRGVDERERAPAIETAADCRGVGREGRVGRGQRSRVVDRAAARGRVAGEGRAVKSTLSCGVDRTAGGGRVRA